jgi:hypothetical protein
MVALAAVALSGAVLPTAGSAANWGPVQNLSAAGAQAIEPKVAFDPGGNALAIWHRSGVIQTRFRPRGGSFEPVQNLSPAGVDSIRGDLAFDGAGNALAVWGRGFGDPDFVQSRLRFAGGGLGTLQPVATGDTITEPGLAVDPAGNALVVWSRRFNAVGDNLRVETRFRPAGGSFEAIETHSSPGVNASREQVAMDPAGNAIVIWQRPTFGDNRVQARFRPAGGAFGLVQNLSVANQHAEAPQVAFDPEGNAIVTWSLEFTVQARFRPAGGNFGPTQSISGAAENSGEGPQVAFDGGGNALIVWSTTGAEERIKARSRSASGTLGAILRLSADGEAPDAPRVAVDPAGNAVAVWERDVGANRRIEAAFRPAGGSFESAQAISAAGEDAAGPQVAFDAAGNALAVWHRFDGNHDRVQARFLPGPGAGAGEVLPSNEFRFGKVKRNKKRGTAKLTVIVPGPGQLELAKNRKVKPKGKRADSAGRTKLPIKPKRKAKKRLKRKGKAKVRAKVTYTPDGGVANTKSKRVKLKKRLRR